MELVQSIVALGFATSMTLVHILVVLGLVRQRHRERCCRDPEIWPSITIVIPAKDEEANLPALFQSLKALDYPSFDVVLIDDRSKDRTGSMMEAFRQEFDDERVSIVVLTENPGPNFKQQGLKAGVKLAKGEIIALTDADCTLDSLWLKRIARHFTDLQVGLVLGPVYKEQKDWGFFMNFQAFDHIFRFAYAAGVAGIGFAGGGFGNNIAVRKEALDAIGGYDGVPYSVTEDAALISTIHAKTHFGIRAQTESHSGVMTAPVENWNSLVKQELRWHNGGIYSPEPQTRHAYTLLMLLLLGGILVAPLLIWFPWMAPMPLSLLLGIGLVSLATGFIFGSRLKGFFLWFVPNLLFIPVFYSFLTVLSLLRVKVVWKDNTMKAH